MTGNQNNNLEQTSQAPQFRVEWLFTLVKAIETANAKAAFSELELTAIRPAYDGAILFLNSIAAANAQKAKEATEQVEMKKVESQVTQPPATVEETKVKAKKKAKLAR